MRLPWHPILVDRNDRMRFIEKGFSMIRVLIVDDQNLIRQGLKTLLELELDLQIVGEAENGQIGMQ